MALSLRLLLSNFLVLFIFYSPQIEAARESKFFSKVTHHNTPTGAAKEPSTPDYTSEAPVYAPSLAPSPAPAPGPASSDLFQPDTQDGYGLYGRASNEFSSPTTTGARENEVVPEEMTDESYQELTETSYENNNNNNNNNVYAPEKQGMSDTRYLENGKFRYNTYSNNNGYYSSSSNNNGYSSSSSNNNGYSSRSSNNNGYYSSSSNNNGYSLSSSNNNGYSSSTRNNGGYYSTSSNNNGNSNEEKQGMSDTRFMENGKYFYDLNNENNYYPDGYSTEKSTTTSNEAYYNSNTQNSNEFNSMEEYEQGQDEYVP